MGRADKNGQCALVHAALKGHADIISLLLGQDWGAEPPTDPPQHHGSESVTGKAQAVQQAVTAAASLGHTQVQGGSAWDGKMSLLGEQNDGDTCSVWTL